MVINYLLCRSHTNIMPFLFFVYIFQSAQRLSDISPVSIIAISDKTSPLWLSYILFFLLFLLHNAEWMFPVDNQLIDAHPLVI